MHSTHPSAIILLQPSDIDLIKQVAKLHREIFPQSILSNFDVDVVSSFYTFLIESTHDGCLTALFDNEVVGFLSFASNRQILKKFFRRRRLLLIKHFAKHSVQIIKLIASRLIERFLQSSKSLSLSYFIGQFENISNYRIIALGVATRYQSCGIATQLLQSLYQEMSLRRVSMVDLSVDPNNRRAVSLYAKEGWYKRGLA